jgi:hypothetical protein
MVKTVTVKREKISGHASQRGLDTKTDRLTASRNVTLTLLQRTGCFSRFADFVSLSC